MTVPRVIAITGILAVSVQAGPCKPSSVATTTTETTATDPASITGTTTSGTIATTSETILAPSSTGYTCTNNEKPHFQLMSFATLGRTALTANTATTEVETSSTVLTTSSADLATSTETTTPAAATTTAGIGCPDGFPSEPSCGVFQEYTGGGNYINDISGTYSVQECLWFCTNDDTCTLFSHGSDFCGLWNGDFSTNRVSVDWSWYELGCFCVERAPVD